MATAPASARSAGSRLSAPSARKLVHPAGRANSTPASSAGAIRGHCAASAWTSSVRGPRVPPADPPDAHNARHTTRCARLPVHLARTRIPTAPPCPTVPGALIRETGTATVPLRFALPLLPIFLMAALLLTATRSFERARSAATQKSTGFRASPTRQARTLVVM